MYSAAQELILHYFKMQLLITNCVRDHQVELLLLTHPLALIKPHNYIVFFVCALFYSNGCSKYITNLYHNQSRCWLWRIFIRIRRLETWSTIKIHSHYERCGAVRLSAILCSCSHCKRHFTREAGISDYMSADVLRFLDNLSGNDLTYITYLSVSTLSPHRAASRRAAHYVNKPYWSGAL